jgi:Leucine-rich repeat (LRR) protein
MSGYIYGLFWNASTENFDFVYTDKNQEKSTLTNTINSENIKLDEIYNVELTNIQIDTINDAFCKLPFESLYINKCKINSLKNLNLNKTCKKITIIDSQISDYDVLPEMNLEYIKIQSSNIKFDVLCNCIKLREIIYKNNQLTEIPNLLNLKFLHTLSLSNNKIKNIENLKNLIDLHTLDLSYNEIENIIILNNLKKLKYVYLNNNNITNLNDLEDLTNIIHLNISSNNIKNIDMILNYKNLEILNIKNNKITILPNLLELKKIDFDNLQVDWNDIRQINGMKGFLLIKNIIKSLK